MLSFQNVLFQYPQTGKGVRDLTFTVGKGEVVGLLGPNGAGKSTTIRLLLGLLDAQQGEITLDGKSTAEQSVRARVGYLPEVPQYYPYMTFKEALCFYGGLSGLSKRELTLEVPKVVARVGAEDVIHQRLDRMSKGQLQRLGLAQALIHKPDVLILDEPMSGLDPLIRVQIKKIIEQEKLAGRTILFSSHELNEIQSVCDRFIILKDGQGLWEGNYEDLQEQAKGSLEEHFVKMISSGI